MGQRKGEISPLWAGRGEIPGRWNGAGGPGGVYVGARPCRLRTVEKEGERSGQSPSKVCLKESCSLSARLDTTVPRAQPAQV